jgi:hypothetical protein
MNRSLRAAAAAAIGFGFMFALPAVARADTLIQGQPCQNWHVTAHYSNGPTLPWTHLPLSGGDSGHVMYWEDGGAKDSAFKTDQQPFPHTPGGPPCNENDGIVTHVTSGGNAIEDWGPAGCDNSKPMIDGPHH